MHVHATQVNPYAALDALRSAARSEARREAERVRQELMESASEAAGEASDDFVIHVEERSESQKQRRRDSKKGNQEKDTNPAETESREARDQSDGHISDYA
jgi:hypothetical protein